MDAQQLANLVITLLPRVNLPLTVENAQTSLSLYDTLGKMARGELILSEPKKD